MFPILQGDGLAKRWEGWQSDVVDIQVSDLLSGIKSDDIWSNSDAGISWDAFEVELSGPRKSFNSVSEFWRPLILLLAFHHVMCE